MRIFRVYIFLLFVILFSRATSAQQNNALLGDTIFPSFVGGTTILNQFIRANVDRELLSKVDIHIEPSDFVVCKFTIDTIGYPRKVNVIQGIHPIVDEEAIRIIYQMPKWRLGAVNGQKAELTTTISIGFNVILCDSIYDFNQTEKKCEYEGSMDGVFSHLRVSREFLSNFVDLNEVPIGGHGMPGRTICSFIIDKEGEVGSIKIQRSVDPLLDRISLLVVSSLKRWKPAENNGEAVCVRYVVPISYPL